MIICLSQFLSEPLSLPYPQNQSNISFSLLMLPMHWVCSHLAVRSTYPIYLKVLHPEGKPALDPSETSHWQTPSAKEGLQTYL